MGDLPCRIAQAHTAAEQTRKWDEGNNRKEGNQGKQKIYNYHPSPSQIKLKVKRSQMRENTWEGER